MNELPDFLNDRAIAHRMGFSPGWVRLERFRRRHGQPHTLQIDPIIVGTKPRYLAEDVDALIEGLKAKKECVRDGNLRP